MEGIFDAAVSTFDGLNYLTLGEFRQTLAALARRLRPGGWLVFDLHTDAMLELARLTPTFAGEQDGNTYLIHNVVDLEARTCDTRIEVTAAADGEPFTENHRQYFHRDSEVALSACGCWIRHSRRSPTSTPTHLRTNTPCGPPGSPGSPRRDDLDGASGRESLHDLGRLGEVDADDAPDGRDLREQHDHDEAARR